MSRSLSILLFSLLILPGHTVFAEPSPQQRQQFLEVEQRVKQQKQAGMAEKIAGLRDYPLHSYLWYQWLKKNLHRNADIEAFFAQYSDGRFAEPLRKRWLKYLASQQQWRRVVNKFKNGDDSGLQCHYYWALYNIGDKLKALQGAGRLWAKAGSSLPKHCDPLLEQFVNSKYLTDEIKRQRFKRAIKSDNPGLAQYLKRFFNPTDKKFADSWLAVHNSYGLLNSCSVLDRASLQSGEIFIHGTRRLARKDLATAIEFWDLNKGSFDIDPYQTQKVETDLAVRLVKNRNQLAHSRFKKLDYSNDFFGEWRVKAALMQQDWNDVASAIAGLSETERQKSKWRYWRARALSRNGQEQAAQKIFNQLAKNRSFYGFIAADAVGRDYQLSDVPVLIGERQRSKLLAKRDFRAIREFIYLDRPLEVTRQWWFAVKNLDRQQILAAAKLAQQWGLHQLAIATIAKAEYWDDIDLRFPLAYQEQITQNAKRRALDPAIVYGLIRRESAFNVKAESPVGAKGLMQIMPLTGQSIARSLKQKWSSSKVLFEPERNVSYGAFYYKKLLDQFNGHYALAAAGYNAGPHRVRRWLPEKEAMPADIWIELIPFNETRKYVSAVLTYALIYQQRLHTKALSMSDFLVDVSPGKHNNTRKKGQPQAKKCFE